MDRRLRHLLGTVMLGLWLVTAPAYAVTFKIATVAPEGTSWMREMRAGALEIERLTEGRVKFKFYGGGVMGNESSVLRKMRFGQLQGGAFTGGGVAEMYPTVRVYGLPLVFEGYDEIDYVRSQMDQVLLDGLQDAGYVSFGFSGGGFAMLMSNQPVRTLDDLRGKKVWVPEGDQVSYQAMEALGLSPVTLPLTDVLTGLQTGLIEIIPTSPLGAIAFQWFTKVRYVTALPVVYVLGTMVIDKRSFDRLTAEDQQILRDVMGEVYRGFDRQNRVDDADAAQALRDQGLTFVSPDDQLDEWRATMEGVIDDLIRRDAFDGEVYRQMRAHLDDYRAKQHALEAD